MRAKVITGSTFYENLRLQQSIAAIMLTKNGAFTNEEFSAKVSTSGKEDVHHSVGLSAKKLGEIHAQKEGFIKAFKTGDVEHIFILVGIDGAIQFSKEKEFVINLKGLDNTKDYSVYAIGGYKPTNQMYKYERGTVNSGDNTKTVSLEGVMRAWVGLSSNLDNVKVNLSHDSPEHPVEELKALNNIMNDIVRATQTVTDSASASGDKVQFGFVDLLGIPYAPFAKSMMIVTDGSADVEYYTEKGLVLNF